MNVLDLFSGIGGFSLGLERAGMRTVAFCERDEFCRAVLRKHWPDVPCFDDIRAIDADGLDRLGRIDLVCGGFPCQPFSHAGKQRAQADDRYLWPAMREVIALARPSWVLGENVTGIIPLALDDVLADLEAIGYNPRAFVIPAVAVNARHRRDRVWIIARHADRKSKSAMPVDAEMAKLCSIAADPDSTELRHEPRWRSRSYWEGAPEPRDNGSQGAVAHPGSELRGHRHNGAIQDGGLHQEGDERGGAALSNQGHWDAEPNVGRVAYGVPRRVDRLRALGNAVVPQVVEEIGRAIMKCAHTSTGDHK